jgi:hypothetical protein
MMPGTAHNIRRRFGNVKSPPAAHQPPGSTLTNAIDTLREMNLLLVLGTWALVIVTIFVARRQSAAFREDLQMKLQLKFAERFDSPRMAEARGELAQLLLKKAKREEISETVMDFFEDVGLYVRHGYLNEEMVWDTFGFYAFRWWIACKDYVLEERRLHDDQTLFTDFENLGKRMRKRDMEDGIKEPTTANIETFLKDEL